MNDQLAKVYTLEEIERMGKIVSDAGIFGLKKPEEAIGLMLKAQASGRHPASILDEYDIIQGRAALKSKAALARFQKAGGTIEWLERTDSKVSARFHHPQGGDLIVTWDDDRVKKMGLADRDSHKKQPMVMKSWRVVAEGIRMVNPACLTDDYLVEEVIDFEPARERDITPREEITQPTQSAPPADNPFTAGDKISDAQRKRFYAKAKTSGWTDDDIKAKVQEAGFERSGDITKGAYDDLCAWADGGPKS